jgi:phage-related protein
MLHKDAPEPQKRIEWIGSTKEALSRFPLTAKRIFGQALFEAQCGRVHQDAKPMKGNLRNVMEVSVDDDGLAFRAMYTTKIGNEIYALHAFNKKSTDGISTPQRHLDLIEQRLKEARAHHERYYEKSNSPKSKASRSKVKGKAKTRKNRTRKR